METFKSKTSTFQPELVPTWAKVAAWAAPVTTLPSGIWRVVHTITVAVDGWPAPCTAPDPSLWENIYLPLLSLLQLGLALLTVGLIRPWGEIFPKWLPGLGRRRVPITLAAATAAGGAALVWSFLASALLIEPQNSIPPGCTRTGWEVARWYLPMFLWPPLLLAVTWHYLRRRRG